MNDVAPTITYGSALGRMFSCAKENLGPLVQASLVFSVPGALVGFASTLQMRDAETLGPGSGLLTAPVGLLVGALSMGAITVVAADALAGREVSAASGVKAALRRVVPLSVAVFVAAIAMYVSMLMCFVPVLLVAPGLALIVPILMLTETGPFDAIGTSWRMTRGHRRAILSAFGAILLITGILNVVVTVLLVFGDGADSLLSSNPYRDISVLGALGLNLFYLFAGVLASVLMGTLATVFYVRIKERGAIEWSSETPDAAT